MQNDAGLRAVWIAIMSVVAALIGIGGGVLSWLGGMNVPTAILAGFAAFAGGLMLQVQVFSFATGQASNKAGGKPRTRS